MSASSAISIGCEQGGPEPCLISDLKVGLYRLLKKHVTSTHCEAIDEYALVLRVDGSLAKYGEEGLARMRFAKARRYITLDIQVPETVWKPLGRAEAKRYLADQVLAAMRACIDRLVRDKYMVSQQRLEAEVNAAVSEYLGEHDAA